MLTETRIKALRGGARDQFVADTGGLYLRVTTSGRKTFVVRHQRDGKSRWRTIGVYPEMSLVSARAMVNTIAAESTDPIKAIDVAAERHTVRDVYREFLSVVLSEYKKPEISQVRFKNDILPGIGQRPIADVTRREVFDKVLQPIINRGSRTMANRTLADVKHLFKFAFERGYIDDDPTLPITRKSCGGKEVPRDRVLSFNELEAFLHTLLDDLHGPRGMHVTTIAALYLCVLTGQRASEALWILTHWRPGQHVVKLPPNICKSPRAHIVHLSRQARAALKFAHHLPPPRDHRVLSHALRRINATFKPHDLRRTLATRLSDLGVEPYVIEKLLNHRMTGVMAVYNHAEYLAQREAALTLWGSKIAELRRKRQRPKPL